MNKHQIAAQSQLKRIQNQRLGLLQQANITNLKKSLQSNFSRDEFFSSNINATEMMKGTAKSFQKLQRMSIDRRMSKPRTNIITNRATKSSTGLSHDPMRITDFKQLHKIGQGSYSSVKIFTKDNCKYACKIFRKPLAPQVLQNIRNEIEVLKKTNHDNIVRLHYSFEDTNHLYIVLQYVEGKTLSNFLKKAPAQQQVKSIARQLVSAVGYLHTNNIAHRDLKLDNVMIDEANNNRVVLIDFGFSTSSDRKLKIFCGTPSYMCPEIVKRSWYSGVKADMWALGVIFYRMVTGNFPFRGNSQIEVFGKICKSKYDQSKLSIDQSLLLRNLLCKLENDRHKCSQVVNSPWLAGEPPKSEQTTEAPEPKNQPLF